MGSLLTVLVLLIFQYLIGELLKSKQRGEKLHRIATTDELTGLANRERFRARLDERIASATTTGEMFGVMLLDLDRFKEVNDTLGHHFGDELLRDLGPRLAEVIGADGLVARLGGDEFAVLPGENTGDADELEAIAGLLTACVQQPVGVDEMTLEVGVSIGIARFPRDGDDPHSLLRSADVAMYAAKEAHAGCKVYATALDRHSVRKLSVLSDFRRALDTDEVVVFYQPIMHMDGTSVHGAEALVRWEHPELGSAAAVGLHADRRADGPDRAADPPRARARGGAVRGLAAGRPGADGLGQPVGAEPARPGPAVADLGSAHRSTGWCRRRSSSRSPRAC